MERSTYVVALPLSHDLGMLRRRDAARGKLCWLSLASLAGLWIYDSAQLALAKCATFTALWQSEGFSLQSGGVVGARPLAALSTEWHGDSVIHQKETPKSGGGDVTPITSNVKT